MLPFMSNVETILQPFFGSVLLALVLFRQQESASRLSHHSSTGNYKSHKFLSFDFGHFVHNRGKKKTLELDVLYLILLHIEILT